MASLFGPSPQEIMFARQQQMQEQQALRQQQIAQQGQQFGIFAPLYQAGLQLGDVGTQAAMQSLFPTPADPALQRATAVQGVLSKYQGENLQDPEVLSKIASDLMTVSPEAGLKAADLATKFTKDKPKPLTPSDTFAQVGLSLGIQPKTDLTQYTPEEAKRITDKMQEKQENITRAGVPQSGQVDIKALATAQDVVDQFIKGPSERLSNISPLRTQLQLAKEGNGAAFEQVRGQLVKLVGDTQISNAERSRITGGSGIVEDAINRINTILTGTPTQGKLLELERMLVAFEDVYAKQYNRGVDKASKVMNEAKFSPETRAALLPQRYVSAADKANAAKASKAPVAGTIQNGYRFKGGNPADKNNWELVR